MRHAVDAIIAAIEANPGIVLVTLGPLTNIALALAKKPEIADQVSRCVIMGGAPCCEGNITPAAEYNIYVDPEAARMVMRSGLPVELVGWHLCRGERRFSATTDIARILGFQQSARAKFADRVQQPRPSRAEGPDRRRRHLSARPGGHGARA